MKRCIELAEKGLSSTYPNPLVGSVIVHNDTIIGEGWHYKSGEPHAEVLAIESVKDKKLLPEATIYVSLEPCSHFGKTPPCANLIIQKGIKNVVIGSKDPNPKVSGKGIKLLQDAGCNVTFGALKKECNRLNKRFFTYHKKKRPYIILKWAQTANGFIAPKHKEEKKPVWITNPFSRQLVHKWRSEEQAILVGTNTVIQDNPSLTVRDWFGKNPLRCVIDKNLIVPDNASVFSSEAPTVVFAQKSKPDSETICFEKIDFSNSSEVVKQICRKLYLHTIQSVIIEGGAITLQTFIDENLWDEARIFTGNTTFKDGIKAPNITGKTILKQKIDNDHLTLLLND